MSATINVSASAEPMSLRSRTRCHRASQSDQRRPRLTLIGSDATRDNRRRRANHPLRLDYGGRQNNASGGKSSADVACSRDERRADHDDSPGTRIIGRPGPKGGAVRTSRWLVPRQVTSPRAVRFSTELPKMRCIPKRWSARPDFRAQNGDEILWQKIAPSSPSHNLIHENSQQDRGGGRPPATIGGRWSGDPPAR